MSRSVFIPALLLMSSLFFSGCGKSSPSDKDMLKSVADSFTTALYNFQYGKAIALCDSNSRKAIYFFCSNLNEKDIDIIRNAPQGTSVEIKDVDYNEDGNSTVVVTVKDFFCKDSIGQNGYIKKEETYKVPLKKVNGQWKVCYANRTIVTP